tara:strand:+ start:1458 stop:1937 length:480 start_codon:yes stop_codon:yes gene_type:complete
MIKVIDNFLDDEYFKEIKDLLLSFDFPWYFNDFISDKNDPKDYYYFIHMFYQANRENSNYYYIWNKFLQKIDCKAIMRIKGNMYMNSSKKRKHKSHTDFDFPHKGCLLYLNDNNGETFFGKETVQAKANRVVFFDPHKPHSSSCCTDQKRRLTVNFNYF